MSDQERRPISEENVGTDVCPNCGGSTTQGFGLMGGGYGPYTLCDNSKCGWMAKAQVDG